MLVFTSVILTYPSVAFPWRFGVLDSTCSGRTCVLSDCMAALAVPEEEVSSRLPWQRFGLCYYRGASYFRTKVLWFCFDSLVLLVATLWPVPAI